MDSRIEEVIISEKQIIEGIKKAAQWVDSVYKNEEIVIIGLLKGCIPFFGQLVSNIKTDLEMDFMVVSSFKGMDKAVGLPEIVTDIKTNIKDKHVLLVEDIVDSGYTVKYVLDYLNERSCKSIKVISLLNKQEGRKVDFDPDYYCFDVPNKFLVGFGLDYKEKFRNLPYIGVLKKGVYSV